jgi:hypothetical protein
MTSDPALFAYEPPGYRLEPGGSPGVVICHEPYFSADLTQLPTVGYEDGVGNYVIGGEYIGSSLYLSARALMSVYRCPDDFQLRTYRQTVFQRLQAVIAYTGGRAVTDPQWLDT